MFGLVLVLVLGLGLGLRIWVRVREWVRVRIRIRVKDSGECDGTSDARSFDSKMSGPSTIS